MRARLESENAALRAHQDANGTSVDLVLENAELRIEVNELTDKLEVMHIRMTRRLFGSSSGRHNPDQQVLNEMTPDPGGESARRARRARRWTGRQCCGSSRTH